jgi:AcrR family transcriptional regulator
MPASNASRPREILAAAHRLLLDRGYSGTTIEAIAEEAGVAIQTIYSSVGNKRAVLWAVMDSAVVGDDAPRTLLERVSDELDGVGSPRERLRRLLRFGRPVMERSADVRRIMRSAASTDSEIDDALDEAERRRYQDSVDIVRLIAGEDGFAPGMDAGTAADLWFALTSYEIYELLIGARAWSPEQYERWIGRTLESLFT